MCYLLPGKEAWCKQHLEFCAGDVSAAQQTGAQPLAFLQSDGPWAVNTHAQTENTQIFYICLHRRRVESVIWCFTTHFPGDIWFLDCRCLSVLVSMKEAVFWALVHPSPLAELSLLLHTSSVSNNLGGAASSVTREADMLHNFSYLRVSLLAFISHLY